MEITREEDRTDMEAIDVMKQAYASNYTGSITALIEENEAKKQAEMLVAATPEQQSEGLRNQPTGTSMAFPNVNGKSFNTNGMKEPIDIQGYDNNGGLVQSYKAVPPGINDIPMGPKVATVIENPTQYATGGYERSFAEKVASRRK